MFWLFLGPSLLGKIVPWAICYLSRLRDGRRAPLGCFMCLLTVFGCFWLFLGCSLVVFGCCVACSGHCFALDAHQMSQERPQEKPQGDCWVIFLVFLAEILLMWFGFSFRVKFCFLAKSGRGVLLAPKSSKKGHFWASGLELSILAPNSSKN